MNQIPDIDRLLSTNSKVEAESLYFTDISNSQIYRTLWAILVARSRILL